MLRVIKKKDIIIISIALVVSFVVAISFYHILRNAHTTPPENTPAPQEAMVASKNIEAGEALSDNSVTFKTPTPSESSPALLLKTNNPANKLKTLIARTTIKANQFIHESDIYRADENDLATFLKPGMRAITIETTTGGITPGDLVDVIMTTSSKDKEQPISYTILCSCRVLALGHQRINEPAAVQKNPSPNFNDKEPRNVTLEVKAEDVEKLTTSTKAGNIFLSLRANSSVNDHKCVPVGATQIKIYRGATTN